MDLRCRKRKSVSVASVHQAKNAATLPSGMAGFSGASEVQQPCPGSGLLVSRSCDAMEFRGESAWLDVHALVASCRVAVPGWLVAGW